MPDPKRPDLQAMSNWPSENWTIRKALEEARRFFSQPSPDDPSKTLGEKLSEGLEGARRANYRPDLRQDIANAIDQSERSAEKPIVSNPLPETASPMHARDWRLFIYLGIPIALAITVFGVGLGAFVSGSPHWGFGLCAPSALVLSFMGVYLLNAKPKSLAKPPYPFAALTTIAVLTWAFIGWQTWLWFHTPAQGYTQAQLDEAVAKAKAAQPPVLPNIKLMKKSRRQLQRQSTT